MASYKRTVKPNRFTPETCERLVDYGKLLPRSEPIHNYIKIYPKFVKLYKYAEPTTNRVSGFEDNPLSGLPFETLDTKENNLQNSLRRTKTTITDIILSNDFNSFATFTFNCRACPIPCEKKKALSRKRGLPAKCICPATKCLRNNPATSKKRISKWINNLQARYGRFSYIIVPEYHKDKQALHFHALIKDYPAPTIDSGHVINSRTSYNLPSYNLGFSSLVKIDNLEKVSSYVRKYITKDMPHFEGKNRYFCSQGLERPTKHTNVDILYNPQFSPHMVEVFSTLNFSIYKSDDTLDIQLIKESVTWQSQQKLMLPKLKTPVSLRVENLTQLSLLRNETKETVQVLGNA